MRSVNDGSSLRIVIVRRCQRRHLGPRILLPGSDSTPTESSHLLAPVKKPRLSPLSRMLSLRGSSYGPASPLRFRRACAHSLRLLAVYVFLSVWERWLRLRRQAPHGSSPSHRLDSGADDSACARRLDAESAGSATHLASAQPSGAGRRRRVRTINARSRVSDTSPRRGLQGSSQA